MAPSIKECLTSSTMDALARSRTSLSELSMLKSTSRFDQKVLHDKPLGDLQYILIVYILFQDIINIYLTVIWRSTDYLLMRGLLEYILMH
ncbi:hypothetical protein QQ045_004222 [Rhodiola kirilowii]